MFKSNKKQPNVVVMENGENLIVEEKPNKIWKVIAGVGGALVAIVAGAIAFAAYNRDSDVVTSVEETLFDNDDDVDADIDVEVEHL